ncbi:MULTISPECIES: hypothetical protein [unclassified Leptolyngbya]|uniref:hypothetical protein n=1 Tax=unclassified Leptolyngbya TaxID=2650499 RepID=UPI001687880A|nr:MULTISPECIES: hypothetical protein [unclassified Leptolyngbya]MBD1912858.1 hypothetical protein [Leptolyngbya sp. FACHB-8]MBD2153967.1 hypothetical protein [Leptolyngbya sp. FACHB-16]
MTDDELKAQVSELVPFIEALTDEEFVNLLHTVSRMQISRGLQAEDVTLYPATPEEIIAILEAIKNPGARPKQ